MRNHEFEFNPETTPANFRQAQEKPVEILGRFTNDWKNLQLEYFNKNSEKNYHQLDAQLKKLRGKIETALKKPPLVFHPESLIYIQLVGVINEVRDLEQTIEQRPAA